jgi:hypothetical protein
VLVLVLVLLVVVVLLLLLQLVHVSRRLPCLPTRIQGERLP